MRNLDLWSAQQADSNSLDPDLVYRQVKVSVWHQHEAMVFTVKHDSFGSGKTSQSERKPKEKKLLPWSALSAILLEREWTCLASS